MDDEGGFYAGWNPAELPLEDIDWEHRSEYIQSRSRRRPGDHDISPEWATEAALDISRLVAAPDPASKSGKTIRVVGQSVTLNRVLVVILLPKGQIADGRWWGVNAWLAGTRETRLYFGPEGGTP